jgi:hypothetical protein
MDAIEFDREEEIAIENMNIAMGALRYELPASIWQDVDRRYRDLLAAFAVRIKKLDDIIDDRRHDALEQAEARERMESWED